MVAPRRLIALPTDEEQRQRLLEISRSRTEPTSRVERARIILAYLEEPSAYAVTQQTVTRCLKRAAELGVIEALDDRPRAGRDPVITAEAKTWLVALACQKPKELGLSARAVDHSAARRACPSIRTVGGASQPREPGPRNGLQNLGRATRQAAQSTLLPREARSRLRAQDGRNPLCLPAGSGAA